MDSASSGCVDAVEGNDVSFAEAKEELERILSDPEFHCTDRHRKFLRFVTEELVQGRGNAVKAYSIAVDVFGRPPSFDPSVDPIVRIEATRLRAALAGYYDLHAQYRPVRIDLPRGRYVPTFSRTGEATAPPAEPRARALPAPPRSNPWTKRLFPSVASRWAFAAIGIACGMLIGFLLFAPAWAPAFSEKPRLTIEMKLSGGPSDNDAVAVRDALIIALSGFQTARISAPDATTASIGAAAVASRSFGETRSYRLFLRFEADRAGEMLWWQVVDEASGEAARSGAERADAQVGDQSARQLATKLAIRLASSRGVINTLEATRELDHPTLGNGCVLRAMVAIDASDKDALAQSRDCLARTLAHRPNDADAHALLAAVLLKLDPVDAPVGLTDDAVLQANRAVAQAPDSDRSYYALMSAQFRIGNIDAAILAGRRALDLNPNNTMTTGKLARILFVTGRWEEGSELARTARRLGDDSRDAETTLAFDAYRRGAFDETLRLLNQIDRPDCYCLQTLKVATLAQLGRFDEANAAIAVLRSQRPQFESSLRADLDRRRFAPDLVSLLEAGLAKAGLKVA